MTILISGSRTLSADPERVWMCLNNVDVLRASIPGCESLVRETEQRFSGVVRLSIGPVKANFRGTVSLTDVDPPRACVLVGKGDGGIAGFAKGSANVELQPSGNGGTLLTYHIQVEAGGKIAQLGARLMKGTIERLSDVFFSAFSEQVAQGALQ